MNQEDESKINEVLRVTREFDELELISIAMLGVAVPFDAPREFKARVLAAAGSYLFGNKSVDYQLRRYNDYYDYERPSPEERVMFDALIASKRHVSEFINTLSKFPNVSVNSGRFAAEACLLRLQASFKSAILLVRQGFTFEASAICRLILEQLAWAYAVHEIEDHSFFELEPNRCITNLKNLLPTSGRFYGSLSKLAHLHPNNTPEYIEFEGSQAFVLLSISHLRWSVVFDILNLADWFQLVGEFVVFDHISQPKSIYRNQSGELAIRADRPFLKEILSHAQKAISVGAPIKIDG